MKPKFLSLLCALFAGALAHIALSGAVFAQDNYSKSTKLRQPVQWTKVELNFIGRQTDRIVNDNGPVGHSISDTADSYGELIDAQKKLLVGST